MVIKLNLLIIPKVQVNGWIKFGRQSLEIKLGTNEEDLIRNVTTLIRGWKIRWKEGT